MSSAATHLAKKGKARTRSQVEDEDEDTENDIGDDKRPHSTQQQCTNIIDSGTSGRHHMDTGDRGYDLPTRMDLEALLSRLLVESERRLVAEMRRLLAGMEERLDMAIRVDREQRAMAMRAFIRDEMNRLRCNTGVRVMSDILDGGDEVTTEESQNSYRVERTSSGTHEAAEECVSVQQTTSDVHAEHGTEGLADGGLTDSISTQIDPLGMI